MKSENDKLRLFGDFQQQDHDDLKKIQGRYSPVSVLLITLLGIAVAEVFAMIVVYFQRHLPYYQQVLIDAAVMTVIIFPLLYYLSFRPLLQHIEKRYEVEKAMQEREQKELALLQTIHTMHLDIARDLHDTIGQNIGFLRMRLDYLVDKDLPSTPEAMKLELVKMSQVATESYDLVRGTLAILQSKDAGDLLQLFKRYASQVVERSEMQIEFSDQGQARILSAHQMRQLFYVFREALSNIEKHSNASHARVEMRWESNGLTMTISDDGQGFDVSQAIMQGHYGLKFMRERIEMLKGSFEVRSKPEAGTQIIIGVPVQG